MTFRHSPPKNGHCYHRQEEMGTQTPKAAGSSTSTFQPDVYQTRPSDPMDIDLGRETAVTTWAPPLSCTEGNGERQYEESGMIWHTSHETSARDARSPPIPPHQRDIPDQLADLLISMISDHEGHARAHELAEAFLRANDFPPVTKQSLCELDIQNIITNMKLRHDVNFDRDLSFRPNFDGIKGQGKRRTADQYWNALVAELKLYERLFQEAPLPRDLARISRHERISHAKRRLPKMFQTIRDVLRSLVPDRDHARVDEHFDVQMLMQEIERGVCDMVRLAEWIAGLLKEHCAPMRDILVDGMVHSVRQGVTKSNHERPELIVQGLRELLGILEAMKLDVANHQIRNLKPVLIEDTINFEYQYHYHLDKMVHAESKVKFEVAQSWFENALDVYSPQSRSSRRHPATLPLECFARAAIAPFFSNGGCYGLPETFYLDHERLNHLKVEIEDLVYFEVCTEMFVAYAKGFGYRGPISPTIGQTLRNSLSAILGEVSGQGLTQWTAASGPLSWEILRQASRLAGKPQTYSFDHMAAAAPQLRNLLRDHTAYHAARIEALLLPCILDNIHNHVHTSPMDLFHNLVPVSPGMPPPPSHPSRALVFDTTSFPHLHPETARLTDLANRITHILLLHWRVWARIAYVPKDAAQQASAQPKDARRPASAPLGAQSNRPPPPPMADDVKPMLSAMKTGELPDAGQETPVAHDSRSPRSQ